VLIAPLAGRLLSGEHVVLRQSIRHRRGENQTVAASGDAPLAVAGWRAIGEQVRGRRTGCGVARRKNEKTQDSAARSKP
jgi:hypothetical protein